MDTLLAFLKQPSTISGLVGLVTTVLGYFGIKLNPDFSQYIIANFGAFLSIIAGLLAFFTGHLIVVKEQGKVSDVASNTATATKSS